ncbi:MAG: pentapeptide repeat-containing protein [Bacteroidia bacterium]|nr:pentapeptide repeat-containing protein [Bacteroidia bacterium]
MTVENTNEEIIQQDRQYENITFEEKILKNRVFIKCSFHKSSLKGCTFENSVFEDCVFDDCDISLMKFKDTSFSNVTLKNCKAIGVLWVETNNPFSINCTNTRLSFCSFYSKSLKKSKFVNCIADEVDFSECNLAGADFTGTDLRNARFLNCDLSKANFVGALNYFIDARSNKISKARFSLPEALSFLTALDIELE